MRDAGHAGNVGRMDPELDSRYGERLMRVERVTELPMLVLAFAYVPVFVVGYLRDVPDDVSDAARVVSLFIIAAFAIELVVKVAVARGRLAYLRSHWLDVIIVFVPFLRPLRILRVLSWTLAITPHSKLRRLAVPPKPAGLLPSLTISSSCSDPQKVECAHNSLRTSARASEKVG